MPIVLLALGALLFFFQAEDGIRDLVRSRGLGDVYKRQGLSWDTSRSREAHQAYSADLAWALAWAVARVQGLSLIHI